MRRSGTWPYPKANKINWKIIIVKPNIDETRGRRQETWSETVNIILQIKWHTKPHCHRVRLNRKNPRIIVIVDCWKLIWNCDCGFSHEFTIHVFGTSHNFIDCICVCVFAFNAKKKKKYKTNRSMHNRNLDQISGPKRKKNVKIFTFSLQLTLKI